LNTESGVTLRGGMRPGHSQFRPGFFAQTVRLVTVDILNIDFHI